MMLLKLTGRHRDIDERTGAILGYTLPGDLTTTLVASTSCLLLPSHARLRAKRR
jgi:hypothetical protein